MKNILVTGARGFIGKHLSSKLLEEKNFEVLNIGSGVSNSVAEVIKIIQQVKGTNFQVESSEEIQDEEILHTCADITKAKKLLNWAPIWSFEKGIQDSYGK